MLVFLFFQIKIEDDNNSNNDNEQDGEHGVDLSEDAEGFGKRGDEEGTDDSTNGDRKEGVPGFHADESPDDGSNESSGSLKRDHDKEHDTDEPERFYPSVFFFCVFSFVFNREDEFTHERDFFREIIVPD